MKFLRDQGYKIILRKIVMNKILLNDDKDAVDKPETV